MFCDFVCSVSDASSKETKWSLLRKQEIDNMTRYLVQKEERLKVTKNE